MPNSSTSEKLFSLEIYQDSLMTHLSYSPEHSTFTVKGQGARELYSRYSEFRSAAWNGQQRKCTLQCESVAVYEALLDMLVLILKELHS